MQRQKEEEKRERNYVSFSIKNPIHNSIGEDSPLGFRVPTYVLPDLAKTFGFRKVWKRYGADGGVGEGEKQPCQFLQHAQCLG